jgi:hypothetical protein
VPRGREIGLGWLRVGGAVAGQGVLVIDDTWVSGGSAQSVAVALKLAGAARVAIVVLGRHVDPADPRSASLAAALAGGTPVPRHECVMASSKARAERLRSFHWRITAGYLMRGAP